MKLVLIFQILVNKNKKVGKYIVYFQEIEPSVGEALIKLWDRREPFDRHYRDNQYDNTDHYRSYDRPYHQPMYNPYHGGNQYYPPEGNTEMFNPARLYGSMNTNPSTYSGYMVSPPRHNPVTILQRQQNRRYQNYGRPHGPGGDN